MVKILEKQALDLADEMEQWLESKKLPLNLQRRAIRICRDRIRQTISVANKEKVRNAVAKERPAE